LTGSQGDGTAYAAILIWTCENWTAGNSTDLGGVAQVGHHDRAGNTPEGVSWKSAQASSGCGHDDLRSSGGDGLVYCFLAQ
jgi:hypothetical protein